MQLKGVDCVRNEEVLRRVKEERNIVHKVKRRKESWICHSLRGNCILKQFVEEKKLRVTGRRG